MNRRTILLSLAAATAGCRPAAGSKERNTAGDRLVDLALDDLNSELYSAYLHEAAPDSPGVLLMQMAARSSPVTSALRARATASETGRAGRDIDHLRRTLVMRIRLLNLGGRSHPAIYVVTFEQEQIVGRRVLDSDAELAAWKAAANWRPDVVVQTKTGST